MQRLIKRSLTTVASSRPFVAFLSAVERMGDRRTNLLRVLTYHRIARAADIASFAPGLVSATPDEFARQMRHVRERCHAVSIEEVLDAFRGQKTLPPRAVLITFDDGYRDFARFAWPTLKEYGLPALLFVPTSLPDQPKRAFWWERLYRALATEQPVRIVRTPIGPLPITSRAEKLSAYRSLSRLVSASPEEQGQDVVRDVCAQLNVDHAPHDVMTWDQLRGLAREGLALAPHSRTHCLMNRVSLSKARWEATGSRDDIRRQVGEPAPVFAYPGGASSVEVRRMLATSDFELAFSTRRGVNHVASADPYCLRRINVGMNTTTTALRAQLLPALRLINPVLR